MNGGPAKRVMIVAIAAVSYVACSCSEPQLAASKPRSSKPRSSKPRSSKPRTPKPGKLESSQSLAEPGSESSITGYERTNEQANELITDATAPSCEVSANEFVWRVGLRNPTRARDRLVGECITEPWSAHERLCVKVALSPQGFSRCVDSNVQLILEDKADASAIGIAGCDRIIVSYRRCIRAALPTALASDTEEALVITLNRWQQTIADDANNGWRTVQRDCHLLSGRIAKTMRVYGCDAQ